jgi:UDP-N-acetylglucosamine 2-epimerase (non-hydrolysing)
MKILSLAGARPQYIKESILNHEFRKRGIKKILVNSGQHYDYNMAGSFFKTLDIKSPDYNLNVGSGKHGEMTGKILTEFEKVVEKEKPDTIVVYGDTNTTLAGALVAAKLKIRLAHVEAGLRMKPKTMPEEINRVLTDHISDLLFAASKNNVACLKKEGITKGVYFTGDVTYDLFLKMKTRFNYNAIQQYGLKEGSYVVTTIHRDYNVDTKQKLRDTLLALQELSAEIKIVFPMHPRTKKRVEIYGLQKYLKGILVLEPIEYFDLMGLVSKAEKVITDSGGLQKEAYFAGKRCLVAMPDTGWIELLENGNNVLCNAENLIRKYRKMPKVKPTKGIFGMGNAGEKIVDLLLK